MRTRSEIKGPTETKRSKELSLAPRKQSQTDEERKKLPAIQHETKIRTPIRTPKLKAPKCKNIVQTPGRDDVLCSQHFDSQVVVGWDCNSPDTLRGIKRISGSEQQDDVSDFVMRLIGEDGDDDILTGTKRSTPALLGVWREDNEDKLLDDNNTISHRLRRNRTRQRKKSGKDSAVSKDLLNKLSLALDKCNEEDEVEEEKETEIFLPEDETKKHNCSDDLFQSESISNIEVKTPRTSSRLLEKKNSAENKDNNVQNTYSVEKLIPDLLKVVKNAPSSEKIQDKIEINTEPEENWSDDELFEEDSFIVKATQLSSVTKKFVSPVFGVKRKTSGDSALPKSKCSRYTFQLGSDDEKDTRSEKYTSLQNKQLENKSSRSTRNLNTPTKLQTNRPVSASSNNTSITVTASSNIRSNTVTSRSSNRPPVYPVSSYPSTTNNLNVRKSVQELNNCVQSGQNRNGATNNRNVPVPRQKGNVHRVSNNYTGGPADKPLNSKTSSALTNVSFKKHSSFSGPDSTTLVTGTSRRRSVSGDNFLNSNVRQGSSVLKSSGSASSSNSVRSNIARLYPAASRSSVITSSIKSMVPSYGSSNNSHVSRPTTSASSSTVVSSSSRKPAIPFCDNTSKEQQGAISDRLITSAENNFKNKRISQKTDLSNTKLTSKDLPDKNVRESKRSSIGGFDTSLSDDLLCQLAEPDDILDSQDVFNVTITPVRHVPGTTSSVLSKPSCIVKPSNVLPNANSCQKSSVTKKNQSTGLKMVDSKQHAVKQYTFKQSQRKATSPAGNKQCVGTEKTAISSCGTTAKTKGPAIEQYSEDLFASDDDDDMLLADDDGLTEPQILAMLDEVELMATQQQAGEKSNRVSDSVSHVETKVQSVEKTPTIHNDIDQDNQGQSAGKSRTSDHGTDLLGSQGQLAGSQGQPAGSQGPSNSQTKYSPEEIERKKWEAMERRKRKLKKV